MEKRTIFDSFMPYSKYQWPLVINFHSCYPILNQGDVFHRWDASTHRIKNIINYLYKDFDFIDINEYYDIIVNKKASKGKILITFDDGYKNIYSQLYDFLNQKKIKPIVYLISDFLLNKEIPWYLKLSLLFRNSKNKNLTYENENFNLKNYNERINLYTKIELNIQKIEKHVFEKILADLYNQANLNLDSIKIDPDMEILDTNTLKQLISNGWGIGSHTCTHYPLNVLKEEEIERELKQSKLDLEKTFQVDINSISYPNGSYNENVLKIAEKYYKLGFTVEREGKELISLPRLSFPQDEQLIRDLSIIPEKRIHYINKKVKYLPYMLVNKFEKNLFFSKKIKMTKKEIRNVKGKNFNNILKLNKKKLEELKQKKNQLKKVLILCGSGAPERKAVAEIAKKFNLAGVVIHNHIKRSIHVLRSDPDGKNFTSSETLSKCLYPFYQFENTSQQIIFGNESLAWFVDKKTPVYEVMSINDLKILDIIKNINPEIIFVFGTGLIKNDLLKLEIPMYNLHWGISPWYRGCSTEWWPVYNNDYSFLGVTIHRLERAVDGGEIIAQKKVELDGTETMKDIEFKVSLDGINLIVQIIHMHNKGKEPLSIKQDLSVGKNHRAGELKIEMKKEVEEKLLDGWIYKNYQHVSQNNDFFVNLTAK